MNRAAAPVLANDAGRLIAALLERQPWALARAITIVENDAPGTAAILAGIRPQPGRAHVVGVTGPPGAGKSTLIGALIHEMRKRDKTVGVLAVDPSSPISGGAILGDRVRMGAHAGDPGVFVRSLASRGHLGGLFRSAWGVLNVMDAYGSDLILVETVGAGQSEVEIGDFAHTRVVLCAPGAGDDIQAIKAGILEIADILVVNKADQPAAEQTVAQLRSMLALRDAGARPTRLLSTVASTGRGVAELADLLEHGPGERRADLPMRTRRLLADAAAHVVRTQVLALQGEAIQTLCDRLSRCELDLQRAAHEALRELGSR